MATYWGNQLPHSCTLVCSTCILLPWNSNDHLSNFRFSVLPFRNFCKDLASLFSRISLSLFKVMSPFLHGIIDSIASCTTVLHLNWYPLNCAERYAIGMSFIWLSSSVYSWVMTAGAAWSEASVKITYLLFGSGYFKIEVCQGSFRYSKPVWQLSVQVNLEFLILSLLKIWLYQQICLWIFYRSTPSLYEAPFGLVGGFVSWTALAFSSWGLIPSVVNKWPK